jgi:hypothetical protein
VKINKLTWVVLLVAIVVALSACGSASGTQTPLVTRGATQTPIYIYVPVTVTPEPATITPLPTAIVAVNNTPTRTPTKAAAVKTATKPAPTVPVVVAPSATAPPACNLGTVALKEPEANASRNTKEVGVGGDTFRFIWDPPPTMIGVGDPSVGYLLTVKSKSNGSTIYLSNNKYWNDNKVYVMDKPAVSALAGGVATTVSWNVQTIKVTSGSFNDSDPTVRPAGFVTCGTPTETRIINLGVF